MNRRTTPSMSGATADSATSRRESTARWSSQVPTGSFHPHDLALFRPRPTGHPFLYPRLVPKSAGKTVLHRSLYTQKCTENCFAPHGASGGVWKCKDNRIALLEGRRSAEMPCLHRKGCSGRSRSAGTTDLHRSVYQEVQGRAFCPARLSRVYPEVRREPICTSRCTPKGPEVQGLPFCTSPGMKKCTETGVFTSRGIRTGRGRLEAPLILPARRGSPKILLDHLQPFITIVQ